jgi:hypothetical protein
MSKRPILLSDIVELKIGKTTFAEVVDKYGAPQHESLSGNARGSCYYYGTPFKQDLLYFQFDEKNVLKKKHYNDRVSRKKCSSIIPKTYKFDNNNKNYTHDHWSSPCTSCM